MLYSNLETEPRQQQHTQQTERIAKLIKVEY